MSDTEQKCPNCSSPDCYHDGTLWICPLCNHEWTEFADAKSAASTEDDQDAGSLVVKDANGNPLQDGDAVVVIKDLPVKGGTKVKSIRIAHDVPGHNIVCRIEGFGQIHLKSEYVKKA